MFFWWARPDKCDFILTQQTCNIQLIFFGRLRPIWFCLGPKKKRAQLDGAQYRGGNCAMAMIACRPGSVNWASESTNGLWVDQGEPFKPHGSGPPTNLQLEPPFSFFFSDKVLARCASWLWFYRGKRSFFPSFFFPRRFWWFTHPLFCIHFDPHSVGGGKGGYGGGGAGGFGGTQPQPSLKMLSAVDSIISQPNKFHRTMGP